jgi:hypothetical protein
MTTMTTMTTITAINAITAMTLTAEPSFATTSRPRPGPGFRVAPPAPDSYAPWAAALAEPLATGRYHWVMSEDGALVPVALSDDAEERQLGRTSFGARLAALLGR